MIENFCINLIVLSSFFSYSLLCLNLLKYKLTLTLLFISTPLWPWPSWSLSWPWPSSRQFHDLELHILPSLTDIQLHPFLTDLQLHPFWIDLYLHLSLTDIHLYSLTVIFTHSWLTFIYTPSLTLIFNSPLLALTFISTSPCYVWYLQYMVSYFCFSGRQNQGWNLEDVFQEEQGVSMDTISTSSW